MSTPKKNAATKKAENTTEQVVGHRAFAWDKDGNVHEATPEEMANAKAAHITVVSKSDAGVVTATTYDCHIKHYDNGNIGLAIRASNTLDDTEIDNPDAQKVDEGTGVKNDKITLIGRGNPLGAAFALVMCYRAYGTPFGQALAYRMVKMTLDRDTKCWHGLFVPALAIASM